MPGQENSFVLAWDEHEMRERKRSRVEINVLEIDRGIFLKK